LAALPLVVMPGIIQLLDNQITSSLLKSLPPSVDGVGAPGGIVLELSIWSWLSRCIGRYWVWLQNRLEKYAIQNRVIWERGWRGSGGFTRI
jgi:hypothetical protein